MYKAEIKFLDVDLKRLQIRYIQQRIFLKVEDLRKFAKIYLILKSALAKCQGFRKFLLSLLQKFCDNDLRILAILNLRKLISNYFT